MKLKWEDKGFKSPLARAKGLGAGHDGTGHWMKQRVTSVASLPLVLWLVWSLVHLGAADYAEFTSWLARPVNAILMILFVIAVFTHAILGAQVVIEDYVHSEGFKFAKLTAMKLFYYAAAVTCIFSVLKVAFAG